LYPLVVDAFGGGKISVGRPYFDTMFSLIAIPLLLLLGIGPTVRWKVDNWKRNSKVLSFFFIGSLVLGLLIPFLVEEKLNIAVGLGLAGAIWVASTTLKELFSRLSRRASLPFSYLGMVMGHLGLAVFVVGVVITMQYHIEKDIRMVPGESYDVAGYEFRFVGVTKVQGPNYTADEALIETWLDGKRGDDLVPQKRIYSDFGNPMTEASIDVTMFRDLYAALGEELENGAWSMRVYYKPFIRWIWAGAAFMAIGGFLAISDRRYRLTVTSGNRRRKLRVDTASAAADNAI
ncbi:c-type cytochrome biogenesis protein CcmF, partial [Cardiobacterium sp. AH-315-I02]|nr:c-type cytochrome biogenesis protein CcmF [Cardiobacterium sp. AH-315-I02]